MCCHWHEEVMILRRWWCSSSKRHLDGHQVVLLLLLNILKLKEESNRASLAFSSRIFGSNSKSAKFVLHSAKNKKWKDTEDKLHTVARRSHHPPLDSHCSKSLNFCTKNWILIIVYFLDIFEFWRQNWIFHSKKVSKIWIFGKIR